MFILQGFLGRFQSFPYSTQKSGEKQEAFDVIPGRQKFALARHFATLHSGFYLFSPIKAGMERSEMTGKPHKSQTCRRTAFFSGRGVYFLTDLFTITVSGEVRMERFLLGTFLFLMPEKPFFPFILFKNQIFIKEINDDKKSQNHVRFACFGCSFAVGRFGGQQREQALHKSQCQCLLS